MRCIGDKSFSIGYRLCYLTRVFGFHCHSHFRYDQTIPFPFQYLLQDNISVSFNRQSNASTPSLTSVSHQCFSRSRRTLCCVVVGCSAQIESIKQVLAKNSEESWRFNWFLSTLDAHLNRSEPEESVTYLQVYSPVAGSLDTTIDFDSSIVTTTTGPTTLGSNSSNGGRLCVSVRTATTIVVAASTAVGAGILDLLVLALVRLVAGCYKIRICFQRTETPSSLTLTAVVATWLALLWALTHQVFCGFAVVARTSRARLWTVLAEVAHLLAIATGDVLRVLRLWAIGCCHAVSAGFKDDQMPKDFWH